MHNGFILFCALNAVKGLVIIMTRNEFLLEKYRERIDKYRENNKAFYTNPSIARIEPFKIADNLYYVGDKKVCIHLIDTGDGLILLDSGYLGATHLLIDSIWRAGFDPKNVRWIIHTHGHSDHYGASEEFRIMYGTKLAISRVDARIIDGTSIASPSFPFAKVPKFDYELEDGEIFELGKTKIRCVLTPGHTDGVLSLFFDVTHNGKTYMAGMYGGAGVNAVTLPYLEHNNRSADCAHQMLSSIDKIWNEPVVVHIGNHPYNNHTLEKRAKQLEEGGNPFVEPNSWRNFLSDMRTKIKKIIADNEEMEREISNLN